MNWNLFEENGKLSVYILEILSEWWFFLDILVKFVMYLGFGIAKSISSQTSFQIILHIVLKSERYKTESIEYEHEHWAGFRLDIMFHPIIWTNKRNMWVFFFVNVNGKQKIKLLNREKSCWMQLLWQMCILPKQFQ